MKLSTLSEPCMNLYLHEKSTIRRLQDTHVHGYHMYTGTYMLVELVRDIDVMSDFSNWVRLYI